MELNLRTISVAGGVMACAMAIGTSSARADLIPPGSHYVERCVRISNGNEHPEFSIVSLTVPVTGGNPTVRVVSRDPNECMVGRGYKFNSFDVFIVPTVYLRRYQQTPSDNGSLLMNVPIAKSGNGWIIADRAFAPVSARVNPDGGYVDSSDPVVSVTTTCAITVNQAGKGDLVVIEERENRSASSPASRW